MTIANHCHRLESESGLFLLDHAGIVSHSQVLVVAPMHDTSKPDATGAFHPGARAFRRVHGLGPDAEFRFDNKQGRYAQADSVISEIERRGTRVLVGFHHGYMHGVQWGLRSPNHPRLTAGDCMRWDRFIAAMSAGAPLGFASPVVVLFACSTGDDPDDDPDTAPGSGDGSFADKLRDGLCHHWATQCRVVSHTTAGHAWYNRDVKIFDGTGDQRGGYGAGMMAVDGDDADETATRERRRLADLLGTDWAFTFPFRPIESIRADLS